jgi:hypothetical protein
MTTASEREAAFRAALKSLCEEHGAELEVTDDGRVYMAMPVLRITMPSEYDGDDIVKQFCEFNW